MNTEFIRSFALIFGATIALICAVYVYLMYRRTLNSVEEEPQEQLESN